MPRRQVRAFILLTIVVSLLMGLAYGGALHNGVVWDDPWLTTKNPYLSSVRGLGFCLTHDLWTASALGEHSEFYRPLVLASYALDRAVLGNVARSYHLGSLVIHALCAIGLGVWMQRRTKTPVLGFAAAAIFATLPLASEPVLWIAGRFDSLGLAFVLVGLCFAQMSGRRWVTPLVVACAVAALACKETFLVLAPALLAIDDFILARTPPRSRVGRYVAIVAADVLWLLLRHSVGVASPTSSHTSLETLAQSYLQLVWTFGGVLLDGGRLDAYHPYAPLRAGANVVVVVCLVAASAAVAFAARGRWSNPAARLVVAGWVWTLVALVPVTIAGPTLDIVGDRYAYASSAGLVCVVVGLAALARHLLGSAWRAVFAAVVVGTVVLGVHRCRARVADWASDRTLVVASLRVDPDNAYALGELGSQWALEHRWPEAEESLRRAIAHPGHSTWRAQTALCFVYLHEDRFDEAAEQCEQSLQANDQNPRAWLDLATVETRRRRWAPAVEHADRAIALRPTYAEAHFVRALALAHLGKDDAARDAVARALDINPNHPGARALAAQLGLEKPR